MPKYNQPKHYGYLIMENSDVSAEAKIVSVHASETNANNILGIMNDDLKRNYRNAKADAKAAMDVRDTRYKVSRKPLNMDDIPKPVRGDYMIYIIQEGERGSRHVCELYMNEYHAKNRAIEMEKESIEKDHKHMVQLNMPQILLDDRMERRAKKTMFCVISKPLKP